VKGKNQQHLYLHPGKTIKLGTTLQLQPRGSDFLSNLLEVPALLITFSPFHTSAKLKILFISLQNL
jgi:hypothetical protein